MSLLSDLNPTSKLIELVGVAILVVAVFAGGMYAKARLDRPRFDSLNQQIGELKTGVASWQSAEALCKNGAAQQNAAVDAYKAAADKAQADAVAAEKGREAAVAAAAKASSARWQTILAQPRSSGCEADVQQTGRNLKLITAGWSK